MTRALAAVTAAMLISGCASSGSAVSPSPGETLSDVSVRVENNRWFEMRIFVEGGIGMDQPLGIVRPRSSAIFRLPPGLVRSGAELRLMADPVGSTQRMRSEPLDLETGRNVEWELRKSGRTRLTIL